MSMPPDWWQDFFSGLATEFWHAFPTPAQTRAEVDLALGLLSPAPGAHLLDVPCGDGRHARDAIARGFRVDAVDASAALLAYANATPLPAGLRFHERDMRDLPWRATFDAAWCLGNSFGYLGDAGDAAFLAAVRVALRPGARFLVDLTVVEALLPNLVPRRWYEAGGITFLSEVAFDPVTGIVRSDYTLLRGNERERKTAFSCVRSCREAVALFTAAGFAEVRVVGPDGLPFRTGTPRAFVVARA